MSNDHERPPLSRRGFLKRAGVIGLGSLAARGVYEVLDELDGPQRAEAAVIRRFQEQYLIDQIEVIVNNGVTVAIPPLHNDVFTATLKSTINWTTAALKNAKTRVENALAKVEAPYPSTAAGLTIVVGWGLPYFRTFTLSLMNSYLPAIPGTNPKQYAVLDAIRVPSDPSNVVLEGNHVMFKFRSDSSSIVSGAERALFDDQNSGAYIGDLFDLTSKRIGFLGRGFGTRSIGKTLALAAGVPGADKIPEAAQLMLGFTSTQTQALGPDNIPSFETLRGVTDQFPAGTSPPAAPCTCHTCIWTSSPGTAAWTTPGGSSGCSRRGCRSRPTSRPSPSPTAPRRSPPWRRSSRTPPAACWATTPCSSRRPGSARPSTTTTAAAARRAPRSRCARTSTPWTTRSPGHRAGWGRPTSRACTSWRFCPATTCFHRARLAMDGVMPDGTNFREPPYSIPDENNGLNSRMRASHRQNNVIPPRRNRSFPLVELLK